MPESHVPKGPARQRFARMVSGHRPDREIADAFDVSISAVQYWKRTLRAEAEPEPVLLAFKAAWDRGLTRSELRAEFGKSSDWVRVMCRRLKLAMYRRAPRHPLPLKFRCTRCGGVSDTPIHVDPATGKPTCQVQDGWVLGLRHERGAA